MTRLLVPLSLAMAGALSIVAFTLDGKAELAPVPAPLPVHREASSRGGMRTPDVLVVNARVLSTSTPTVIPEPTICVEPRRRSLGVFKLTAYSDFDPTVDGRGITASGKRTIWGVVAVDPAIVPLSTVLGIEGMGVFEAADTGGAVRGRHLDIWFPDRASALKFGVQEREVWRIEDR